VEESDPPHARDQRVGERDAGLGRDQPPGLQSVLQQEEAAATDDQQYPGLPGSEHRQEPAVQDGRHRLDQGSDQTGCHPGRDSGQHRTDRGASGAPTCHEDSGDHRRRHPEPKQPGNEVRGFRVAAGRGQGEQHNGHSEGHRGEGRPFPCPQAPAQDEPGQDEAEGQLHHNHQLHPRHRPIGQGDHLQHEAGGKGHNSGGPHRAAADQHPEQLQRKLRTLRFGLRRFAQQHQTQRANGGRGEHQHNHQHRILQSSRPLTLVISC
jgi:hypothetical protein